MLLTLIADWLYPADPPPMKRLSKINQLHHPGPVTRPQFMGFTDFLFSNNISFTLPYLSFHFLRLAKKLCMLLILYWALKISLVGEEAIYVAFKAREEEKRQQNVIFTRKFCLSHQQTK